MGALVGAYTALSHTDAECGACYWSYLDQLGTTGHVLDQSSLAVWKGYIIYGDTYTFSLAITVINNYV